MTTMDNKSCNASTVARLVDKTGITAATVCDCVTVAQRRESVVVVNVVFPTSVLLMSVKSLARYVTFICNYFLRA